MFVAGIRGMASVAFIPFLAIYLGLEDQQGLPIWSLGLHIALLVGVGIVSTPAMGYLSDRLGRKIVLIPGILGLSVLTALLVPFGEGVGLIVLLAMMGIFFYSDQPILTASALDIVGEDVAASTLGVMSFSRFALAAASPLIAGKLYDSAGIELIIAGRLYDLAGPESTFLYIAGLYLIAAVVLLLVPLAPPRQSAGAGHHGHGHGHDQGQQHGHEQEHGHGHEHGSH